MCSGEWFAEYGNVNCDLQFTIHLVQRFTKLTAETGKQKGSCSLCSLHRSLHLCVKDMT
ncbi:hypothetical protein J6590_087622 [Homalodisca vitripennis]|nr:hypothetical protein J6590_087622 [Homalodisca vitripennis]